MDDAHPGLEVGTKPVYHPVRGQNASAVRIPVYTKFGTPSATEALDGTENLVSFPFYQWHHAVIVPAGHPLESVQPLTLEAIADYPIITYHEGVTGRTRVDQTFERGGLSPEVVMSALDSDVIKTYVELGMGVGIIASMAFEPTRDSQLRLLDCAHLFESNTTRIAFRRGHYLRGFAYRFMELCSPKLTEAVISSANLTSL